MSKEQCCVRLMLGMEMVLKMHFGAFWLVRLISLLKIKISKKWPLRGPKS